MTMTQGSQRSQGSGGLADQSVDISLYGLDAASIKSLQTAAGWQSVDDCEFIQFAVGTAHSPLTPSKVYPALRYRSGGRDMVTPLNQVISFSQSRPTT